MSSSSYLCMLLDNSIHASYPTLYIISYNFLTLFQHQFASLMPLIECCSCPLLPLSQCQIMFLFMALRFSRDLNLTKSRLNPLTLFCSSIFLPWLPFCCFWKNFLLWLLWFRTPVFYPSPWALPLIFILVEPPSLPESKCWQALGSVVDNVLFSVLSFSHISSLYMA